MLSSAGVVLGQEANSAPLAAKLAAALDAAKAVNIAAKDPSQPDVFVAALYMPGLQLLVISGKYAAPVLFDQRLAAREYREVYLDLNGASEPESKVFIEDLLADGLRARPNNQPPDSVDVAGKRTVFDGDWGEQNLSRDEYMATFSTVDQRYAEALDLLLAQISQSP